MAEMFEQVPDRDFRKLTRSATGGTGNLDIWVE